MALIVEDGTGVEGADAYVSVAEFIAYWTARADPAPDQAGEPACEAAVRRATQFTDVEWGDRFKDEKDNEEQALEFPRGGKVPQRLKDAVCELAKIALSGPIAGSGAAASAPSQASISSMKAGSVEISYQQGLKSSVEIDHADKFYLIAKILRPLLITGQLNRGTRR